MLQILDNFGNWYKLGGPEISRYEPVSGAEMHDFESRPHH